MAFDPTKIRVAAGRIYFGVTNPTTGDPLALTSGVPATGTEIGLTQGESVVTYDVTYDDIMSDQVLGVVAVFATKEELTLEFTMLEYTATQMNSFLQNSALTTDNISDPNTDLFTIGNLADGDGSFVDLSSIYLVSPIPGTTPQRFTIVGLYQAYQSEKAAMRYTREGPTVQKSNFKAIADLARDPGDYLGQIVVERNP